MPNWRKKELRIRFNELKAVYGPNLFTKKGLAQIEDRLKLDNEEPSLDKSRNPCL
tara:strand:- start:4056 stop:4220 length:165 start_codon:yes stop_codon:yes gene_type:complete